MAIYQGPRRNDILSNGFGTIIDSSLNLYLDPANSACYISGSNSTTLLDLSGKVNNGTMLNGTSISYVTGSGSIAVPGTNVTTNLNIDANPVTLCGWVYATSFPTRGWMMTTDNGAGFDKGIGVNSSAQWYIHNGSAAINVPRYLLPNTWYNVALVYGTTAPTIRLYVNSILAYTGSVGGASVGSGLTIGSQAAGSNLFQGNLAVQSVYKRELTQAEVTQNFNVQATRFGLNLKPLPALKISLDAGDLASYPGSGSVWTDTSGNGYSGSLSSSLASGVLPAYSGAGGGSFYFNGSAVGSGGTAASMIYFRNAIDFGTVYTVDTWINPETTSTSIWISESTADYMLYLNAGTAVANNLSNLVQFTYTSVTNTWQNYVLVRNGGTLRLYINGFLRAAQNTGFGTANLNLSRLGSYFNNQYAVRGYMSTFKVYNGVLDDIQVYNNFQSTRARYGI